MKYSKEEVKQYVREDDVKFIRLAFCDVFGKNWIGPLNMALLLTLPLWKVMATRPIPTCF